jgi:hypothetical protein
MKAEWKKLMKGEQAVAAITDEFLTGVAQEKKSGLDT